MDEFFFFFQAEDGIRDAQESRGLGDVYKRQAGNRGGAECQRPDDRAGENDQAAHCLLYTSDAADDLTRVDLGGGRLRKKKNFTLAKLRKNIAKSVKKAAKIKSKSIDLNIDNLLSLMNPSETIRTISEAVIMADYK